MEKSAVEQFHLANSPPKLSKFNGECNAEQFVKEVRLFLQLQPMAATSAVIWIIGALEGRARQDILDQAVPTIDTPDKLLHLILQNWGDHRDVTTLAAAFYRRQQYLRETVEDYAKELRNIFMLAYSARPGILPEDILRDVFIQGLQPPTLRRDVKGYVRLHTSRSFDDVRREAQRWMREYISDVATAQLSASPSPHLTQLTTQLMARIDHQVAARAERYNPPSLERDCDVRFTESTPAPTHQRRHKRKRQPTRTDMLCRWCSRRGHTEQVCCAKKNYISQRNGQPQHPKRRRSKRKSKMPFGHDAAHDQPTAGQHVSTNVRKPLQFSPTVVGTKSENVRSTNSDANTILKLQPESVTNTAGHMDLRNIRKRSTVNFSDPVFQDGSVSVAPKQPTVSPDVERRTIIMTHTVTLKTKTHVFNSKGELLNVFEKSEILLKNESDPIEEAHQITEDSIPTVVSPPPTSSTMSTGHLNDISSSSQTRTFSSDSKSTVSSLDAIPSRQVSPQRHDTCVPVIAAPQHSSHSRDDTFTQSQNRKKREAPIDPLLASYRFGVTTVACYSWDHKEVNWIASQCKMKKENGSVICTCQNGPEIINGLSFNFQPNAIHFAKVFSKFDIKGQGLVIGILLGIYFLFTLIVIWAHYTERKGVFQWGVFPLADNYAADDYFYLVTVSTGLRTFSGTKSNVSFCLSGEKKETGVRKLSDGVREGFPTASVYHFVMACPSSLGYIQCMRLWHDNSGKGNDASWYLDHIDVMDIQTGELYHFVCEEWLTPENKSSDKVIETANVEDLITLRSMFFSYGKKHITEEHIWISVFVRPQRSRFSRAERVGCCLCFLILAMITSAMFYSGVPDFDRQQSSEDFKIGPIRLSFQQLYYSMVSAIITTLPLGIIMTLFRRSRRYFSESNTLSDIVEKTDGTWATSMSTSEHFDPLATKASINNVTKIKKKTSSCLPWIRKLEQQLEELDKILMIRPDAEELSGTISHRWRYLAWFVVFITVTSCSFFVILYTMEWGQDVTESWLSTFFLTFIESVFIVDPFKVVTLSALLAIFLRKSQVKSLDKLNLNIISFINKEHGIKEMPDPPRMSVSFASSFSDEEIKVATLKRKVHLMIRKILKELAIHFIFLLIVSSLCYSTRTNHDYHMYKLVRTELVDDKNAGFMYVNSSLKYFDWISGSLVPWLFPVKDSMGHSIVSEDRQYTKVWDLYRLGAPRMRQLRMKTDMCPSKIVPFKDCIPEYDIFAEETGEFCLGWSKKPCPQVDQLRVTADAWHYQTEESIWGIPIAGSYDVYGGGGYIANLDINLMVAKAIVKEMKQHSWIDRHTRAVFIEFTLYCPGINHFVNVLLLAEFIDTGGMVPFVSVYPFTIHHPSGALGTYYQICEIMGIGKTAIGIVYVIFVLWKKRCAALKEFWFVLDLIGVIVAVFTVIIFCLRNSYADSALEKMQEDRTLFINFYQVVVWDFSFMICLSLLSVIGCLRLLKLAGYSQRTMKVYYVLKEAAKTLPSFFCYILLILMVFAMVGYILFSRTSEYFKSFIACIETLFTGLLGHSGFKETNLPISEKWITILFFCLFVIFVVVLLTNFFLAILLDLLTASAQVKCAATRPENCLVFIVLWDSILKALGSKRDPRDRLRDNTEQEVAITTEPEYFTYLDDQLEKLSKLSISDDRHGEILLQCIVLSEKKKKINGDANETAI